jgi:hypothetical protein
MTFPFSFGNSLGPLSSQVPVTFTDVLTNGGGTPVETFVNAGRTTAIPNYQAWQRGRSNIVLYGKYSVSGGTPTGMAWRCGSGQWYQFTNETIGGGNWQGTLSIPASYLAQGAFQVKPINGVNVTPSSKADITITDVYSVGNGQSNARGLGSYPQAYSGTFKWIVSNTDASGGEWPYANTASCWPRLAEKLDAAGIPPCFIFGAQTDGTGFLSGDWTNGSLLPNQVITRLNAAATGGYAGFLWDQGEQDAGFGQTTAGYKSAFLATLGGWRSGISNFLDTPIYMVCLGDWQVYSYVGNIRKAVLELAAENSDIFVGACLINEQTDGAHYGTNATEALAVAQINRRGDAWFRAIASNKGYGGVSGGGTPPTIASAVIGTGSNKNKLTITFDRAMANHTDATGWICKDDNGVLNITNAAQGASSDIVVLTFDRNLYGTVQYSFGTANWAMNSTLVDTGTPVAFPPRYTPFATATGTAEGTAIASTTIQQYAHNGSTSGVYVYSGTLSGSISDPDGGTNALRLSATISGGVQVGTGLTGVNVYNGLNRVSFKIRKQTWGEAGAYIRLIFSSYTKNPTLAIGLNEDSLYYGAAWSDVSYTSIGSGWYSFTGTVDMSGADVAGSTYVQMSNTAAGQVIDQSVAHSYDIYDFKIAYVPVPVPVNLTAPVVSGTPTVGQLLSTTNGTWDYNPTSYAYQWKRDGSNIGGATSSTYTLAAADTGAVITVAVTASNAGGASSPATSAATGNVNRIPTNTAAPTVSGLQVYGSTLSVSDGTWSAYPSPTYTYQWKADGTNISGATSSTYASVIGDVGKAITCAVTATNVNGSNTQVSSNSITVNSGSNVTPDVEYLVVAGGGGGGGKEAGAVGAGAGGAGEYRTATGYSVSAGVPITVTVGGGGTGGASGGANNGASGSNSVFGTITSVGGGGGAGQAAASVARAGAAGGSGGGGAYGGAGGASTATGSGNAGGSGSTGASNYGGGGGGGASAAGTNGTSGISGDGGAGLNWNSLGTTYAGGGAGGTYQSGNGTPGAGGGGIAGKVGAGTGGNGTANTGGGGGGSGGNLAAAGGNGGSGIVIIRYPDTYDAAASTTGSPTVTTSGGYRYYTFTASGSITF